MPITQFKFAGRRGSLVLCAAVVSFACLSLFAQGGDSTPQGRGAGARGPAQGRGAPPVRSGVPRTRPQAGRPIHILFLGQDEEQPHNPVKMFPLLAAPLARRGIQLTYAATPADALTPAKLKFYDALMLYGNHTAITPEQEKALLDYVEGGHGLIALHSASAEFTGS